LKLISFISALLESKMAYLALVMEHRGNEPYLQEVLNTFLSVRTQSRLFMNLDWLSYWRMKD
jgi:hypothetical protein